MSFQHTSEDHEESREIKCPVHGYILVSKFITTIIDTPQFQRLRYLKQLGTSYYVWPGASHNRFEHSLGVYHLASLMVRRLRHSQPELNITARDVRCVEVAGLCHDLGHGPFSHVWDNRFIPFAIPGSSWKHEEASEMMLDYLVNDNNIDLDASDVRFIKDLIQGERRHTAHHKPPEKDFLFEIVANKRNGIDVDKFDYIARDSRAVADGTTTDLKRLINTARVIDREICYSEKNSMTVYNLFQDRFNLHKTIYNHKTAKAIELMIVDALLKADQFMKISSRIHDPKKFMHLTDDILLEVERSECPELEESRNLIRRIRNRDLYRMVDKMFLSWELRDMWKRNYTPARILKAAKSMSTSIEDPEIRDLIHNLKEEHIIVEMAVLHHGMGDKFPLDNCKFYGKYKPNEAYQPRRGADISHLLPDNFGELWIRVYTRDSEYYGVIQHAATSLQQQLAQSSLTDTQQQQQQQHEKRRRSCTPEAPTRTPYHPLTAHSSQSSVLSDNTNLNDDSAAEVTTTTTLLPAPALSSAPSTPNRPTTTTTTTTTAIPRANEPPRTGGSFCATPNNYMKVPIGFTPTPKTPKIISSKSRLLAATGGGGDDDDTTTTTTPVGGGGGGNISALASPASFPQKRLMSSRFVVVEEEEEGEKTPLSKKRRA